MALNTSHRLQRWIVIWLLFCAAAILGMVVLGGVTRLTGSGLSIVEWKPIRGILPPLTQLDWIQEFTKYQQHSEFLKVNTWMELEDFKNIFWLEYLHRLGGRVMGILVLIPLAFFTFKRALSRVQVLSILGLFALGGLQGAIGWYMVKSGLGSDPQVSPYKLTLHLLMASGLMLGFIGLSLRVAYASDEGRIKLKPLPSTPFFWLLLLSLLTLSYGGLVAGHKAGLIYNTFPKMGEVWWPEEIWDMRPWWSNLLANPVTVQAVHRVLAITLFFSVLSTVLRRCYTVRFSTRAWEISAAAMVCIQVGLGLMTLLHHVPVLLATLHQAGGVILLAFMYVLTFLTRRQ